MLVKDKFTGEIYEAEGDGLIYKFRLKRKRLEDLDADGVQIIEPEWRGLGHAKFWARFQMATYPETVERNRSALRKENVHVTNQM